MFDALTKSKFYTKCKADIKMTKTRIEMIKRKRNAMQKYLRNDIVDLLKNRLDYNAYGRAEGLLVELNLSSCYDIVEQACACILTHLSLMNKQRECPEECKEAVPTLMFAAARFADLPELRALRSLFAEKYGNSLEPYVNHELVNKSKSTPPTKDMKLQLLQNIALEQGMEWDCKALEQKLYKPPPPAEKISHPNARRTVDEEAEKRRRNSKDDVAKERDEEQHRPHGRKVVPDDDKTPKTIPSNNAQVANNDETGIDENVRSTSEKKTLFGYSSIPPPYTKQRVSQNKTSLNASSTNSADKQEPDSNPARAEGVDTVDKHKPIAKSVRRRRSNLSVKKQEGDNEKDEEERLMDKLLMHYSKIPTPKESDLSELKQKLKDGVRIRTNSLPVEASTSTAEEVKEKRGHARANSFQHEKEILGSSSDPAHPKPLDYDDFIARLAVLRGKGKE